MKLPSSNMTGIGTAGAAGIALMILHVTGYLTGWAWPILYVILMLAGMGQESRK